MSRALLTLSSFGFAAAAGVAALIIRPIPAALVVVAGLLLAFAALQSLRDGEVADEAADEAARSLALGDRR